MHSIGHSGPVDRKKDRMLRQLSISPNDDDDDDDDGKNNGFSAPATAPAPPASHGANYANHARRDPRPRQRRKQRTVRVHVAVPPVVRVVLTALASFAVVWILLLAAVLRSHLGIGVTGSSSSSSSGEAGKVMMMVQDDNKVRYRLRRQDRHDKYMYTYSKRHRHVHVQHVCTCLNETTMANFTNNRTHPYAPPLPYGFEWLHIPKTGSSFAATLWSFACTRRGHIDLSISNDVGGSQALPWSKNFLFHDLYEQALAARYPSEVYCHRDVIGSESIGHKPVTRDNVLDYNVVGFFRQPEERLGSAFDHGLHSTGFHNKTDLYNRCRYPEPGNFTCYATYPGIAGCQARMVTGGECASHQHPVLDTERIDLAVANVRDMAFVGLTEEWGESICQFHRQFGGVPQQEEFGNIHPGHRRTRREELEGWTDEADTVLYAAARDEFNRRRRGYEGCYQVKEVINTAESQSRGALCQPKKCAELGKQCGEWPDGCGGQVVCGVCNPSMDGLPAFWSARCSDEGQCLRICPGWEDAGLLTANTTHGPIDIVSRLRHLGSPVDSIELEMLSLGLQFLTPLDAVRICAQACHGPNYGDPIFAEQYCACGAYPEKFLEVSPTWEDFRNAHELKPLLDPTKARVLVHDNGKIVTNHPIAATAHLKGNATRPRCCDPLPRRTKGQLPPHEDWLPGTIHADFFETIELGCGAHDSCEKVGHERGATVVVYNRVTRSCHLGINEGFDVPASEAFSKREYLLI